MKLKLSMLAFMLVTLSMNGYSQFTFGVSPGLSFNSASFGYKASDQLVVFGGIQYLKAHYDFDYESREYDDEGNELYESDSDGKLEGSLIIPNLGVKLYVLEQNQLKGYLTAVIAKPMVTGKMKSDNDDAEDAFEDQIDGLKLWGGELGFGAEYFFDDNFSVGGEFGLRHIRLKSDYEYEQDRGSYTYEREEQVKLNMSPTYSRVSLNFYF